MSMVINLVEDHNIYLCEGGPVYNGSVPPTPITYLTQWKIVGNSEVHTDPYPDIPQGYTKCKYLEFHSTEYFDTGIIPEQGISMYVKYSQSQIAENAICGTRSSAWSNDSFYMFVQRQSGMMFASYGGTIISSATANNPKQTTIGELIELSCNPSDLIIKNGEDTYSFAVNTSITKGSNNLYIGAINGTSNYLRGKIYEFKLSLNNADIFNGIPCLDDNNVPCLYDTVSQTTLYNQGTGTFGYEIEPQPTEIWSCGEYSDVDNKYHILVQPQGGSIADIALAEPLRKVNDVADTIEFPSSVDGKALVTRLFGYIPNLSSLSWLFSSTTSRMYTITDIGIKYTDGKANILCPLYDTITVVETNQGVKGIATQAAPPSICVYDEDYNTSSSMSDFIAHLQNVPLVFEVATPTTELVDAPQIEEAESYTCVISQGAKAVSWSEFLYYSGYLLTDSENNILVDSENYQLTVQS